MRALVPLLLLPAGIGAGVGGGLALRGAAGSACPADASAPPAMAVHTEARIEHDYVRLNNQFIVPVIANSRIGALVVLSISLEMEGGGDLVYAREPRLRDAFLRVMFDHANAGGFDGEFTSNGNLAHLRAGLLDAGRKVLGDALSDVLITDIARQDN